MSGLVGTCRWCHTLIVRDNDGNWIHISLSYACRDRWGVLMSTSAAPKPDPQPPAYRWTTTYRSSGPSAGGTAR